MLDALRSSWTLFLGLALIMLGNGLQGTLLGVRATIEGFSTATTGIIITGYYLGFLIGSMMIPAAIRNVGHIRVFAALASLASASVLVHSVTANPAIWIAMRVVTGFSYAGLYIVAESWINDRSTNETRGQLLAIYMLVTMGAMGLSQGLLNIAEPAGAELFILVSILVSLAVVPISLMVVAAPQIRTPKRIKIVELYHSSPLGVVGMFASGMAAGSLLGMGAVAASLLGLTVPQISLFMSTVLLGAMLLLWPIGWLSDRFDRRLIMTATTFAAMFAAILAGITTDMTLLYLLVGAVGALSIPLYSLAIAHTNDHLDADQMVAASASLVMVNGLGASVGPLTTAWAMNRLGGSGLFWVLAAIHGLVGLFALYRMTRRAATPLDEQGSFVVMQPRGTPIVAVLAAEEVIDASDDKQEDEVDDSISR